MIVLLINSSQIDIAFMATIANFCNSCTQINECKFELSRTYFINCGAPRTLNLTFVLKFHVLFHVPAFLLSQSPGMAYFLYIAHCIIHRVKADMFVTQVACLSLPVYIHCHAQHNCHKVGHDNVL